MAEGILQPRDKAGYFPAKRCGISKRDGEQQTEMPEVQN
jgi:hypothetical protein